MFVMTSTSTNMAEIASTFSPDDNASDYGDFGSDVEEATIIEDLLTQATSQQAEAQDVPLLVTDIEDYESPHGILLPKDLISTRPVLSQTQRIEVICNIAPECGMCSTFDASLPLLTC